MCYRAHSVLKLQRLKDEYDLFETLKAPKEIDDHPRYNALRFDLLPIVARRDDGLQAFKAQWWLVPHWSKDGKIKATTFNCRAEGIEESRLFGPYFRSSRCLFPVEGFYEDRRESETVVVREREKSLQVKQPFYINMKDERPFLLAGLYAVWVNKQTGEEKPSFTVITTGPNNLMKDIHDRMPVILDEKDFEQWLDPAFQETEKLKKLLVPYPATRMKAKPVSRDYLFYYNKGERHDDPACLDAITKNPTASP